MAAGAFANLAERPTVVQVLGLVALALWLVAAGCFIWVVAVPTSTQRDPDWDTPSDFVRGVAQRVSDELRRLRMRQRAALITTTAAMLVTIAALAWATADSGGRPPERARLELTSKADTALTKVCGTRIGALYGTVDPDKLDDKVVPATLPAGECGETATTVRIPQSEILVEEKVGSFPGFPP